ncbi:WD repeat and coiled-coil-containing protein-like [Babylonia areolata]|uniref:WD repeat and coiled-coil-containing protein-like n=1 Tax=Babylonia areolata TaxID=304850 RepID=UPI003FD4D307
MELGKGKLRRNGMNSLQNAIHEQHGLIWTDGKGIYLAPVHLKRDQKLDNATSLRLGEFDNVQSVHWSCAVEGGSCYMGAVHQPNVTVWNVSGSAPRLAFKQVRKISVQPIPQGCLWNPKCDVLCLLSRQQCSFYFRHTHNRGSFAFPSLENGKISCGCWSPDGKRLVVCVGTALLIYTWSDIEANINDFVTTAWRLPGVSGNITAVVPASNSSVVCASDLPLDLLCANNNQHLLEVPGMGGMEGGSDGGIIRASGAPSVTDRLLNLQPVSKGEVQDAAMLSMVQFRSDVHDPQVLTSVTVPNLLSPDLLHFQVESQCAVVGSNAQCALQVFALIDGQLLFAGPLTLEKDERPKGLCSLHASQSAGGGQGVVVLVGKTDAAYAAFPSTNNTALFSLSLAFFPTIPEKARQLQNGLVRTTMKTSSSSSVTKSEIQHDSQVKRVSDSKLLSSKGEQSNQSPRLHQEESKESSAIKLSLTTTSSRNSGSRLVEDITDSSRRSVVMEVDASGKPVPSSAPQVLETERADFSQAAPPKFDNAVLAKKYEMNWNDAGDSGVGSNTGVSHSQGKEGEERAAQVANGHVCSDKTTPKFFLPEEELDRDRSRGPPAMVSASCPVLSAADRGGDGSSICSSFNSSDSNYEVLEKQIQTQRDQIDALQKRLADLSALVEDSTCVFPVRYQSVTEPEAVTIQCVVGGKRVSRKFLLDNGRLQLDPVKQAFGLLTVELILDGEPLVLGANIDGYIPMRFSPSSQLQVTGIPIAFSPPGLRSRSNSKRDSPC